MDTLGTSQIERNMISAILIRKYKSHEKAAMKMGLSKFTLSRILNGHNADIISLVKILIASGHIEKGTYALPVYNMKSFYAMNKMKAPDLATVPPIKKKGGKK